jgi:hypothetical protein
VTSHCPEGCCETMAILLARVSAAMSSSSGDEGQYAGVLCAGGGGLTAVRVVMTHL